MEWSYYGNFCQTVELKIISREKNNYGWIHTVNSSLPSVADMRQWTRSTLIRVMSCRLFGAKAITWSNAGLLSIRPLGKVSMKFEAEFYHLHLRKCIWKCRLPKWRPWCPDGDELNSSNVVGAPQWPEPRRICHDRSCFFFFVVFLKIHEYFTAFFNSIFCLLNIDLSGTKYCVLPHPIDLALSVYNINQ